MAKSINLEQEEKQAELIDAIIRERFPEEGVEQDMGAACILMNPANPKEAWKQMMRDVTDCINARLGGIVKNLEEGMSRGVHHYYSEESGYSVKRMSDNDAWYGEFYKQHKRRPNKAELLEMAREVYKGNGDKYGMPEHTFEATEEMQEDFDALDQDFANMEVLEDIKEKIDTLPASEIAIMRGLTPSGYKVYQQARKQFESGNTDVQKAGRMNAILLARYAERMADNISKITGQEYTAEDYMRERIGIVPNASDAENGMYGQPITNLDLDLDKEVDVLDLDAMGNALKGKSPKEVLAYIKEISDGVQVPTADFKAMVGLPKNIDAYGQKHIIFSKSNQQRKNIVARNKVLTNFFKVIFATRVVEISPNKKIKEENLTKTQKRKNEVSRFYRLFVPVKMNGQLYTLLLTAEDFNKNVEIDAQEVSLYEISAKKIEDNRPSATLNVQGTLPSKISIREVLQGVKDVDGNPYINSDGSGNFAVYNQTAYHGSPHKFDKFDLGAIGSGEGAQAHGWGLYFAQDKKVSERYQETLARKNRNKGVILYDGKEDAEVSNAIRYYGSAGLYSALSKESRDAVKAQKEISNILVGMHNDIERWDKQVKFYQKHIDRIKENPKLSITAFLKEAPKEDVSKLKDIVDDAKSFARMSGKRTNIKGVLDRLQTKQEMPLNEKDFLTRYANILENLDVDKLEIDVPTGSLLEVDIPENDVLLDEDKALSEQPEKVQKAIRECGKRVAIGKYVDYNGKTYKSVKGSLFGGWIDESDNKHVRRGSELEKELNKRGSSIYEKEYTYNIFKKDDTGVDVYSKLVKELGSPKEASQKLNELGIKGITYEGYRDGRCYVVFDNKAISIIERYNQSAAMNVKRDLGRRYSLLDIDSLVDAIGVVGEDEISVEEIKKFIESLSKSGVKVATEDLSSVFNFDGISNHSKTHIVLAHSQKGRHGKKTRVARNKTLSNPEAILSKAILVEVQPTKHSGGHHKKESNSVNSYRFVIPVTLNKKPQVLVITAVGTNTNILQHMNDIELYEVYNKKIAIGEQAALSNGDAVGGIAPLTTAEGISPSDTYSLLSLLYHVKDLNGKHYVDKENNRIVIEDKIAIDLVEKYVKKFTYSDGVEQRSVASMVRGQTRISGMSRVVSLFESADKSTFVHELGHVALADLKMLAEMDHAPQQLVRDWQTVKDWLGYKDSQGFTREQHERFARGFEAYLRTGEAPVRGLKAVFRTFKKWLCDIYADFIQLGIYNTRLTEVNLSALFDRVIYLLSILQFASCQA